MRSLVFAALVALALAASPKFEQTFEPKNEYHYRFEGLVLSGLPTTSSEISQTRIEARARLQIIDDRTVALQLIKIRTSGSHAEEQQDMPSMQSLDQREIDPEHEKLLQLPVRAQIRDGLFSGIQFDKKDQEWSKNVKRAVLNMLQLNTVQPKDEQEVERVREQADKDNQFFTVIEKTIEGECEVAYTIVKEGSKSIITKSINFEKCISRPEIAYGQRFGSDCEDCQQQGKHVQPQTVYTYTIEKDQIKQVEVRSVYTLNMNGQQLLKTETRSRLQLEEVHSIKKNIESVNGKKEEIIYSAQWEKEIEEFFKLGDKAPTKPFEQFKTQLKMKQVKTITEQIMESENNKPETAHQLARLVRVFRMCTMPELQKIHSEIYKKADDKIQKIMEHAYAIAGTKNTIEHLISHVTSEENMTPFKAAQLLKSVQETQYPSEQIADLLIELAKSSRSDEMIRQSAWLAAGSIVRGCVSETLEEPTLQQNSREIKTKFIRIFKHLFEKAETTYEKVLALKVIGNAGIDLAVQELELILEDSKQPTAVRMESIDALRLLKDQMPRKIQKILLPIYKNGKQVPELRMAALWRLMHTQPKQAELSQIVYQMERDSNQQVAAFTYRLLNSLSKSTNPCHKRFSSDIQTVLAFSRFQPQENVMSVFAQLPIFSERVFSGAQFDFSAIFGQNSQLPKELSVSLDSVFGGNWNQYLVQIGFSQQSLDDIVAKALRKLQSMESEESTTIVRGRRVQTGVSVLKQLATKLNLRVRENRQREQPHAVFYIRYKEMDYAVLPVDVKILEQLIEKYVSSGKIDIQSIERLLNWKPEFEGHHAAFFYEVTRKVPTSLGLPLSVSAKLPTVFSAEGKLSIEMKTLEARVSLEVRPSLVATHVTQMRMWTPLFEQGSKILRSVQAHVPVKIDLKVAMKKQLEIELTATLIDEQKTNVQLSSRPVSFLRFPAGEDMEYVEAEENTMTAPQWQQKTVEIDRVYEVLGMKLNARGNLLNQWTWENAALCEQDIEYTLETKRGNKARFSVQFNIEQIQSAKMTSINFDDAFNRDVDTSDIDDEVEYNQFEKRDEKKRRERFHSMIRDKQSQDGYKHRMTIKVEANEKNGQLELNTLCNNEMSVCKFVADIRRSPVFEETHEWTLKAEVQCALPEMPTSLRQFKEQTHREVQITINSQWGAQKKSQMDVSMQLEQSPLQKNWIRHAERQFNGMPEYEQLIRAARLNQINAVANYKLTRESETVFRRFFELVKAYSYWSSQEMFEQNRENTAILRLTVDPMTRQFVNITVRLPEQRVEMKNVEISRIYLPSIAQRQMRESIYRRFTDATCEVEQDKVNTFDNLIYRAPLTTCYSAIAKDCSSESKFAVMAKKMSKDSEELKVKVLNENDDKIEMEPRQNKIHITVNGKKVEKKSELERYNIELFNEKLVVVQIADGEIRFDGYTVKTNLNTISQSRLCGLCGDNDDEKDNEFRTADDVETDNIEVFHRSYLVNDDECEMEENRLSEKKNYKKLSSSRFEEDSDEYDNTQYESERSERSESEPTEEKTRVIEYSHRVCFSMEPVKECRNGFEAEKTEDKKVRFTCLPRHQAQAIRLLKESRDRVLRLSPEQYSVSTVEKIQVPVQCVAAY